MKEHEEMYREIEERGLQAWDQYFDREYTYDDFMMKPFLKKALDFISIEKIDKLAFEYGCGTGVGACFLASLGFEVDAIDISKTAIELARQISIERKLNVRFEVDDVTQLTKPSRKYSLVLDNYCLQSVVTDIDRRNLFKSVKSHLKSGGYYVFATAIYSNERDYSDVYFDSETGIVYEELVDSKVQYSDSIIIDKKTYIPTRRHLTSEDLAEELENAGFEILYRHCGNFICKVIME